MAPLPKLTAIGPASSCKSRVSLPSPPSRLSLLFPAPPLMVSLPPPPIKVSAPAPPASTLSALSPVKESPAVPPIKFSMPESWSALRLVTVATPEPTPELLLFNTTVTAVVASE